MPKIKEFIKNKNEFKESYQGLKNEFNLISFDGPDGVGKTEITKIVIKKLKEKFMKEGKNPEDIIYMKYTSLMDTESQKNITSKVRECVDKNGFWDKDKIDNLINFWSAKLNRSYGSNILPLIKEGKTIILDRSEVDMFRAVIEWGNRELLTKVTEYMKNGTLTHGITSGNKIFISCSAEDAYNNLIERGETLTHNDPRSLEEMSNRVINEEKAEKFIIELGEEKPNIIKVENVRLENQKEINIQFETIASEIISKLKSA